MKITGDYTFDAPRVKVWEALLDPVVLAAIMPGCEELDQTADNQYEGILNIKVGPVQGRFKGKVQLENLRSGEGYDMTVEGQGTPGFVRAKATVNLADGEGGTVMSYDSDAQVGGRIASVGQRLLDSSARSIVRQSLEGLQGVVKALGEAEDEAGPEMDLAAAAATVDTPTQSEMATQVAKDVAKDLIPKPVLIGGVIAVLIVVLYLLFR